MAVEKNNPTQPETATTAETAAQRSQQQSSGPTPQAAPRQAAPRTFGVMDVNNLRRGGIGRFGIGESVESYLRALEEQIEGLPATERASYVFKIMNRETDGIYMSTVLIARPVQFQSKGYIVVYALPVEASNPITDRRTFQVYGNTAEISWAPTDVLDQEFYARMVKFLNEQSGLSDYEVVYAGGRVLPIELKTDDEKHINRVFHEADQALLTAIEQYITHTPAVISASMFVKDNSRATVRIDPTHTERDNSVGLPVRSSLNIQVSATKNVPQSQQNLSLNQHDQSVTLTRVDAYIDPYYDTRHQQAPVYQGAPIDSRRFFPRVTITAIDTQVEILTPELTLLGVATTSVLSDHIGNWANSLRPRRNTGSKDLEMLGDIGALGLACPLNPADPTDLKKISTDPRSFGDADFETLIERTFFPEPIYTLLVEENGERSFLNDVFVFAASGNEQANARLIRTADNLTDGHFTRVWSQLGGGPLVHNDENRIHVGYFVDSAGQRHDLNFIDTLAMFNLFGQKEPDLVFEWIQTFNPSSGTMEQRLAVRERILRGTFTGVTIKGYARSVTFYNKTLQALNMALAEAGLTIAPTNTFLSDFRTKPQYGVYDPAQFALGANQTGGLYRHTQFGGNQNYRGIGGMFGNFR